MAKKEIGRPQTAHIAPFGLRLQPELKRQIEERAAINGRSMNAEIVARLEDSLRDREAVLRPIIATLQAELEERDAVEVEVRSLLTSAQRMFGLLQGKLRESRVGLSRDESLELQGLLSDLADRMSQPSILEELAAKAAAHRAEAAVLQARIDELQTRISDAEPEHAAVVKGRR